MSEQAYHGGIKQQLAGLAMTVVIGATVVTGVQALHPWVKAYGEPGSPNGGFVVGIGNQACAGIELWGSPGVFSSITDAGICD